MTTGLPMASLANAFAISNMMGKAIVLIQVASSIIAAAIVIGKNKELASIAASNKRFLREFLGGGDVLALYLARKKMAMMALALIYDRTCERLVKFLDPDMRRAVIGRHQGGQERAALSASEIELVRSTCEHVVMEEEIRVEYGMGLLATVVTVSPMLGLLGTVWGVLNAFASMGAQNTVQLSSIAPSISAALLTTVTGLLVAIPSAIFYNSLAGKIRQINNDMEGFADEITGRITCEFKGGDY
ncbi:MAG: MotA/TolQ/ExbB proton channel family protein [Kiritimatiellaeota bacterium]|nr:MotA/TolQ/ExbB proton channel family protein [Kiritimatiellota bacterium]